MSADRYILKRTVAPTFYPVSVEDVKGYLSISDYDQDMVVNHCLRAAVVEAEALQDRIFATSTWTLALDEFPGSDTIILPISPLQSVSSITYLDYAGTSQTLATTVYAADTAREPPRITLKYNQSWPSTYGQANAVTITFVAGYTATTLPDDARMLIMRLAGDHFDNRNTVDVAKYNPDLPMRLAATGRVWTSP